MEDVVFLDEGGVKVTKTRFITFGKTQALGGITSVSTLVRNPKRLGPIILILIGMALVAMAPPVGFLAIVLGVVWLILQKKIYIIQLESASGVSDALESKDRDFIFRVADALNDAIVLRG